MKLTIIVLLCLSSVALADAVAPISPAVDPGGFLTQIESFVHTCWPIALGLGLYGLLELAMLGGKTIKALAWIDEGRTTLVIAGALAILTAALNVALNGGNVMAVGIAVLGALGAYWHPQAAAVVK